MTVSHPIIIFSHLDGYMTVLILILIPTIAGVCCIYFYRKTAKRKDKGAGIIGKIFLSLGIIFFLPMAYIVLAMPISMIYSSIRDANKSGILKAIDSDDLDKAGKIIDGGIDVNGKAEYSKGRTTPLIYAIRSNRMKMASLLISKGADVNLDDEDGISPLEHSIMKKDANMIDNFFSYVVFGNKPGKNQIDIVKILLDKGASAKAGPKGANPLRLSVDYNDARIFDLLIDNGNIDLDALDINHETVLINCARYLTFNGGRQDVKYEMMETLLKKGALVNIRDNCNKTALDYLNQTGHAEFIGLLKKYGAKTGDEMER
jgi:hypothetical protein